MSSVFTFNMCEWIIFCVNVRIFVTMITVYHICPPPWFFFPMILVFIFSLFIWWLLLQLQCMWFSASICEWLYAAQHTAWNKALPAPVLPSTHPWVVTAPALSPISFPHAIFPSVWPIIHSPDKSPAGVLRMQVRSYHFPLSSFQWFPFSLRMKSRLLHVAGRAWLTSFLSTSLAA